MAKTLKTKYYVSTIIEVFSVTVYLFEIIYFCIRDNNNVLV